jgi:hypothetical protein
MTAFEKKLEQLFKKSEEMVASFAKSDVIQTETANTVEGLVYANIVANFKCNLTKSNANEFGLSVDALKRIRGEFQSTYDACAKVIRTASNKERVNSVYYRDFRNRVKAISKGCFKYLLNLEKSFDLSSCEKRIGEFKKKVAKLGIDDPDDSTILGTLVVEAILGSGKAVPSLKKISGMIRNVMLATLPQASAELLNELKRDGPAMLMQRKRELNAFEERLEARWGRALELMEMFYVMSLESGEAFNNAHRKDATLSKDYLFDALTRIHARGCQTFYEIVALLKAGLANGAMARWRSLHELAVISFFLNEHGCALAERYLDHAIVEDYKDTREYQKHCRKLGYEPLSRNEMRRLRRVMDAVCTSYDKDFQKDYGWVPTSILEDRHFKGIERSIRMDRWRPFYKMACLSVHAFAKGLKHRLGLFQSDSHEELLLAGPSNFGLADPAHVAAISLHQITTCLLTTKPTIKRLIAVSTMQRIVEEIGDAFYGIQLQIEEEEKRQERHRSKKVRASVR